MINILNEFYILLSLIFLAINQVVVFNGKIQDKIPELLRLTAQIKQNIR